MKKIFFIFLSLFLLVSCTQKDIVDLLQVQTTWTDATYYNGNDGSIDLNITGGIPPYHVTYNGELGDPWKYNVKTGTYFIVVKDNTNQSVSTSVTIACPSMKSSLIGKWEAPAEHSWFFLDNDTFRDYDKNGGLQGNGYYVTDDDKKLLSIHLSDGRVYDYHDVTFLTKNSFFVTTSVNTKFGLNRIY